MARPDFIFETPSHVWRNTEHPGVYRADPGGLEIVLGPEAQQVPPEMLDLALRRAVSAWVMARGGRNLNLNGERQTLNATAFDRLSRDGLPQVPARRIISIAPSNAEILSAIAAETPDAAETLTRLVAVDSGTDYPPGIAHLPRLGPELFVDLEAIQALKPDLVLASLSVPGMERNVMALERLSIPTLVTAPLSLADILEDVRRVGRAMGLSEAAESVVAGMERRLDRLRARREQAPPTRVLLQWWHHPVFTPSANCWSNELIELAGGVNVFRDRPGQSAEVPPEAVVDANPEVIFLSWCGVPFHKLNPERVLRRVEWTGVTAIREGRVHPLDEALIGRPGPRVVEGAERMAALLDETRRGGAP